MNNLPAWALEFLRTCPSTGSGVHHWLFIASLKLNRFFSDKAKLATLLADATAGCGRLVTEREIQEAIKDSQRVIEIPQCQVQRRRWPERNEKKIKSIGSGGPTLAQLSASSPVQWSDVEPHTEEIIDALFPGNPLLCAGPSQTFSVTRSREEWRGFLARQQFIVPNSMSSVTGKTKDGRISPRTLSNTKPRQHIVVEFDHGTFDEHAAVLDRLGKIAPLVMVVHSGNKSLHGWYRCTGDPDSVVEKFFRYAVSLGADPATWTRCQLVRMPDGQRDSGHRQRVVYFDPQGLSNEQISRPVDSTGARFASQGYER